MTLLRTPEAEILMEGEESVRDFQRAGASSGPLFPIYHFNATSLSRLLPAAATVLDIGCGPARFLSYLLQGRPDVEAIGMDLSGRMLKAAQAALKESRLQGRCRLVSADFASLDRAVQQPVSAVVCISALHHCPTLDSLREALAAIKRLRDRDDAAVWLFDLVRPENESLTELIPRTFEVSSGELLPAAFRADWINSLRAGWTFEEFRDALRSVGLSLNSLTANYSQLHWIGSREPVAAVPWLGVRPDDRDLARANRIAAAFTPR